MVNVKWHTGRLNLENKKARTHNFHLQYVIGLNTAQNAIGILQIVLACMVLCFLVERLSLFVQCSGGTGVRCTVLTLS